MPAFAAWPAALRRPAPTGELHRLLRNFAQPELSAPARTYQFKVEQWDKTEDDVARAAYEAAVKFNP